MRVRVRDRAVRRLGSRCRSRSLHFDDIVTLPMALCDVPPSAELELQMVVKGGDAVAAHGRCALCDR